MNVVVLSFDVLPLNLLGCYGNEWVLTPHIDALAWQGIAFDQHFGTDLLPEERTFAWWTGESARKARSTLVESQSKFVERFTRNQVACELISETELVAAASAKSARPAPATKQAARKKSSTGKSSRKPAKNKPDFARLMQAGLEQLDRLCDESDSWLLWLQSAGLTDEHDPPDDYIELYLDELEELPQDERSLHLILAAASVSHLDHLFGHFRSEYAKTLGDRELVWIITAAAGRAVGYEPNGEQPLCESVVHTPLIVSSNAATDPQKSESGSSWGHPGSRRSQLVQTIDLLPTLDELYGLFPSDRGTGQSLVPILERSETPSRAQLQLNYGERASAVRTESEYLVRLTSDIPADAELSLLVGGNLLIGQNIDASDAFGKQVLLFRKPEDRWEQHDVSRDEPDLTDRLLRHMATT